MSVELAWYQAPSVILVKLRGDVSAESFQAATEMIYDWMDASEASNTHLIVDARELEKLPSIFEISKSKVHQKPGVVVAFGVEDKLLRFISGLAIQILKVEMRFVDTLEEAVAFLEKVDSDLGVLPVREPDKYIDIMG